MTRKQRRQLRAIGHTLKPLINLGKKGLSKQVENEIRAQLIDHELIKLKILDTCPLSKKECAKKLSSDTEIEIVQVIGKTLLLYYSHPDESKKR
tara:strand:- start:633 stop:914 length:282 start_codon:yes stop_codon:yes gene_type:complete